MSQNDKIQLFEDKRIRTAWDEEKEEWFFSIVDVVAVLTDQQDQRGASNYLPHGKTPAPCSERKPQRKKAQIFHPNHNN